MKKQNNKKFTLIELLVVIGIIALLAALLFPAIGSVRKHAKKVKAQAAITALKTAITQYEAQYGILPFDYTGGDIVLDDYNSDDTDDATHGDEPAYDNLIELLSCVDANKNATEVYNTRKTRFLTGLPASANNASEQTLTDPFKIPGKHYGMRLCVAVDLDGNNQVTLPAPPNGGSTQTLNGKVFIWSLGGPDSSGYFKGQTDNDYGQKNGSFDPPSHHNNEYNDIPSWE